MQWNNDTQSYRGTTSDGKIVDVAGDEWAESLNDGIKTLSGTDDVDSLPADQVEQFADQVWNELDDPEMWAGLVGGNQNVTFAEE